MIADHPFPLDARVIIPCRGRNFLDILPEMYPFGGYAGLGIPLP